MFFGINAEKAKRKAEENLIFCADIEYDRAIKRIKEAVSLGKTRCSTAYFLDIYVEYVVSRLEEKGFSIFRHKDYWSDQSRLDISW